MACNDPFRELPNLLVALAALGLRPNCGARRDILANRGLAEDYQWQTFIEVDGSDNFVRESRSVQVSGAFDWLTIVKYP